MKKLILIFSTLLISISVTLAQSLSTEIFSEQKMNLPEINSNFDVPINIAGFPDNLNHVSFSLQYNPDILLFTGHANQQNPEVFILVMHPAPDVVQITYTAPFIPGEDSFDLEDGKLIDLQFDYLGGNSPLNFVGNNRYRVKSNPVIFPINDITNGAVIGELFDNIIAGGIWENANDWSLEIVPDIFHNAIVEPGADASVINSQAVCYNLTINPGGQLTVNDGFSLNVAGDFLIESDAMATGSFVNFGDPLSFIATIKQFMTGMTATGDTTWHLVSVPVDEVMSADVFLNCFLQYWNEPGSAWVDVQADPDPSFSVPMNTPMKGFATAYVHSSPGENKMLVFEGVVNDGAYETAVSNDGLSGNNDFDGWNLVGNPYPSALDVDGEGWTRINVGNGVAYWDEGFDNYRYYADGIAVNEGSRYIPPMQGFFVKASGTGTLGVTNETRAHSTQNFYKGDPANTLRLAVQYNDFSDETVIRFVEDASANYGERYDFFKLWVDDVPMLYSVTSLNEKLAINAMPVIDAETPVNIGLKPGIAASMSLNASAMETFDSSLPIWLYDHVADIYWNLRENPVYNFVANTDDDENRFSIHFKNFTGVPGLDQPQINIYAFNRQLYVDAGSGNPGEIVVVNILGQELVRSRMTENLNVVSLPVSNSYVVVKVISDQGITTRKVYVN